MKIILIVAICVAVFVFKDEIIKFVHSSFPKVANKVKTLSKDYKKLNVGEKTQKIKEKAKNLSLFGLSPIKTWGCIICLILVLCYVFSGGSESSKAKSVAQARRAQQVREENIIRNCSQSCRSAAEQVLQWARDNKQAFPGGCGYADAVRSFLSSYKPLCNTTNVMRCMRESERKLFSDAFNGCF